MSEEIGKHKGAVETLLHEKKELSRILQIVNSQLQRHLSALEEKGVDTEEFMEQLQEEQQSRQQKAQKQRKKKQNSRKRSSQNKQRNRSRRSGKSNQKRNNSDDEEFDLGEHLE